MVINGHKKVINEPTIISNISDKHYYGTVALGIGNDSNEDPQSEERFLLSNFLRSGKCKKYRYVYLLFDKVRSPIHEIDTVNLKDLLMTVPIEPWNLSQINLHKM